MPMTAFFAAAEAFLVVAVVLRSQQTADSCVLGIGAISRCKGRPACSLSISRKDGVGTKLLALQRIAVGVLQQPDWRPIWHCQQGRSLPVLDGFRAFEVNSSLLV